MKIIDKLKEYNNEENTFSKLENFQLYLFIFAMGALVGWIYERLYYFWEQGRWIHSGFFYGPYIPVYGIGAICIYLIAKRVKKHPVAIFTIGIVATGVVEYLTGIFLMAIWHRRWWDYSNSFLNINGYVCLRSVLSFAIGGLLLMYVITPVLKHFIKHSDVKLRNGICIIYSSIFILDVILSLIIRNPIF